MKRVVASEQNTKYTIRLDGNDIQLLRVAVNQLMPQVSSEAASRLNRIADQLASAISSDPSYPEDEHRDRLKAIYNIDDRAVELLRNARSYLDSDKGYRAYYQLAKYLHETNQSDEVLYDLAADFAWDDRLSDAVAKLAKADGFDEVPSWA